MQNWFCALFILLLGGFSDLKAISKPPIQESLSQFSNGLNYLELRSTGSSTKLKFTFGYGPVYENDSAYGLSGVCRYYVKHQLESSISKGRLKGVVSEMLMDHDAEKSSFTFITKAESVAVVAEELVHIVTDSSVAAEAVAKAIQSYEAECSDWNSQPASKLRIHILKQLYRKEYQQFYPAPIFDSNTATPYRVLIALQTNYLPDNCIVTATGNTNGVKDKLIASVPLLKWRQLTYSRDKYVRFIDYKPIINCSQYVDETSTPGRLTFCYQLPGASHNPKLSIVAFLFASYLSANNKFSVTDSTPTLSITGVFNPGVRTSTYELQCEVGANSALNAQEAFINHLKSIPKKLTATDLANTKLLFFHQYYRTFNDQPEAFANILQTMWWRGNPTYCVHIQDSVEVVTLREFQSFVSDYVSNASFASIYHTNDTSSNDSTYVSVGDEIQKLIIPYEKNSSDYNDSISGKGLRQLVQWLKLNPHYQVQVNGISDDGEYFKTKDAGIFEFIDTIPTFRKIMPEIIDKGYIRLELMRSLKITRYLYNNGIATNRLVGTSMMFHSSRNEDPAVNRKCTFTFYVARQRPTLYEQHYGHPKETTR